MSRKGYTVAFIENMTISQFNHLDKSDLKEMTKVISDAVRKRENRIEKAGLSKAVFKNSGFEKGTKGKNFFELKNNLVEGINLLKAETSTVKGARDYFERFKEKFKAEKIEPQNIDKFWSVFNGLQSDPYFKAILYEYNRRKDSNQIFTDIEQEISNNQDASAEEIMDGLKEQLTSWYEGL